MGYALRISGETSTEKAADHPDYSLRWALKEGNKGDLGFPFSLPNLTQENSKESRKFKTVCILGLRNVQLIRISSTFEK